MISCQVPLKMKEIETCKPGEQLLSWQWIISVHDQKGTTVVSRFSLYADARQSVVSSKCFELVSDKQTV